MAQKTVLNEVHRELGARMVDFGGWEMPVNYGSQIEEHHAVRRAAGMFDVSHMRVVDLDGERVRDFLRHLLANSIDKLESGKALYSCMLNERGGVIDDLIVYDLGDTFFRAVVNAATAEGDIAWMRQHAQAFEVEVKPRADFAMIAVQGPDARGIVIGLLAEVDRERIEALPRFSTAAAQGLNGVPFFVARTGYTGEDGFEIMVPTDHAHELWHALADAGVRPAGLAARDTLRLEAGLNLYGQDMDENVTPWEANLGWTVSMDAGRDFIGRAALEKQKADGVPRRMVGVVMDAKGVLRHGQSVHTGAGDGEILSGVFAPTLGKAIGFARVPAGELGEMHVAIRGRDVPVRVVKYPFVRNGKPREGIV
jgi:aminomethyltransferase